MSFNVYLFMNHIISPVCVQTLLNTCSHYQIPNFMLT